MMILNVNFVTYSQLTRLLITEAQLLKLNDCWVTQICDFFFFFFALCFRSSHLELTPAWGTASSFPAYLPVALAHSAEQGYCPSAVWLGHCCPLFQEQTTHLQFAPSGSSCQG